MSVPRFDVVVVGSANVDLVVRVPRRPRSGETVLGDELRTMPGGKGANQAVAAARLGAVTAFVGALGSDDHAQVLVTSLRSAGVDVRHVTTASAATGIALITLTPDGDNSIVVVPGANALLTPRQACVTAVADARVLLLQREVDPLTSLAAAGHCRGRVVLNLAPSGPVPAPLLARVDVLVVNQHEAADLLTSAGAPAGPADPLDVAARLRALGPATAVVTLGAGGAVAVSGKARHRVAAPAVSAVDTTGAGDAFAGALAWRLAAGDDLAAALEVAVRVGALTVTREGAQPSFPTAAELWAAVGR